MTKTLLSSQDSLDVFTDAILTITQDGQHQFRLWLENHAFRSMPINNMVIIIIKGSVNDIQNIDIAAATAVCYVKI